MNEKIDIVRVVLLETRKEKRYNTDSPLSSSPLFICWKFWLEEARGLYGRRWCRNTVWHVRRASFLNKRYCSNDTKPLVSIII